MDDLIARLRAGTVTPADLDAAADALGDGSFYQEKDIDAMQARIRELEAQLAAQSPADAWRRAMEAAAQAADKAAAESARYYIRTDLRHYIDAANALHHFGGVIRAMPLPDDLK